METISGRNYLRMRLSTNLEPISYEQAIRAIKECNEREAPWMRGAEWSFCSISPEEFQRFLVIHNGPSNIGWQKLTATHSCEIGEVARAL